MNKAITVSRLNAYVKMLIGNDEYLSNVLVKGEISNFKHHQSGHMYFTLKDSASALSCVMFRSMADSLKFRPEDGMEVIVSGYISVFERNGRYQLYAASILPAGEGELYRKFEELKKKLAKEGLFDESLKKKLPMVPEKIGVVTSQTGSVIKDIVNVLKRRFPGYCMELYPSRVQGKGAEREIAEGIRYFNEKGGTDVIIIARGGGSIEDLWPFNEELLARAIYESVIPVVSAVGHETDYTIADFVADMRAPTPSAAAELVVPEITVIRRNINDAKTRIENALSRLIDDRRAKLSSLAGRPVMKRPEEIFNMAGMAVDRLDERMKSSLSVIMERNESSFRSIAARLELLSPLATLTRGYAVLQDNSNMIIKSVESVETDDEIRAVLRDGTIGCRVMGKEGKDAGKIL